MFHAVDLSFVEGGPPDRILASCACGWIGHPVSSTADALDQYIDHVDEFGGEQD